jgi:hypothetical protein
MHLARGLVINVRGIEMRGHVGIGKCAVVVAPEQWGRCFGSARSRHNTTDNIVAAAMHL